MNDKIKLSIDGQISHMEESGIKFDIASKQDARKYLLTSNYYFKLKAYDKMFEKYAAGPSKGKYVNLDFAYLQELASLDKHLRHFIIENTLDVEHAIKVHFINDFTCSGSDGYQIVADFFRAFPDMHSKILSEKSPYNADLIAKLEENGYAIWNITEILSFGDFIKLYKFFYEECPEALNGISYTYPMMSIKNLRNAAAHNNCLLNQLTHTKNDGLHENKQIVSFISKIPGISVQARKNCLKMQVIHDFVTLIYIVDSLKITEFKNNFFANLNELFNVKMLRHKEYFEKNNNIVAVYNFMKIIVDTMCKK